MLDANILTSGTVFCASFVWELCKGALGNEVHRRVLGSVLVEKLGDGALPANHEVQLASRKALQDALRALALGLAAHVDPKPSWIDAIGRHLREGTFLNQPLLELRACPEREWIEALLQLSQSESDCARLDRVAIPIDADFSSLLGSVVDADTQRALHKRMTDWLDVPSRVIIFLFAVGHCSEPETFCVV